jgi:hypothetical protein
MRAQATKLVELVRSSLASASAAEDEGVLTAADLSTFIADRIPSADERWFPVLLATLNVTAATTAQVSFSPAV